jgi:toxin FitB
MNGYLLDTNVASERNKPKPDQNVIAWFAKANAAKTYLSVLTVGEVRYGIALLKNPQTQTRAQAIENWLEGTLLPAFAGRVLAVDENVMRAWATLRATARRPLSPIDSLIAATALAHNLTLVTRDAGIIALPKLKTFNPWQG